MESSTPEALRPDEKNSTAPIKEIEKDSDELEITSPYYPPEPITEVTRLKTLLRVEKTRREAEQAANSILERHLEEAVKEIEELRLRAEKKSEELQEQRESLAKVTDKLVVSENARVDIKQKYDAEVRWASLRVEKPERVERRLFALEELFNEGSSCMKRHAAD